MRKQSYKRLEHLSVVTQLVSGRIKSEDIILSLGSIPLSIVNADSLVSCCEKKIAL